MKVDEDTNRERHNVYNYKIMLFTTIKENENLEIQVSKIKFHIHSSFVCKFVSLKLEIWSFLILSSNTMGKYKGL